jgi:hypothetical protein
MDGSFSSLTREALESLVLQSPGEQKNHLIQSFIQGQQPYAKSFASEGLASFASWNHLAIQPALDSSYNAIGFGTPILKPRVAALAELQVSKQLALDCKNQNETSADIPTISHLQFSGENIQNKTNAVKQKSPEKGKRTAKKRSASINDEQEHADRRSSSG